MSSAAPATVTCCGCEQVRTPNVRPRMVWNNSIHGAVEREEIEELLTAGTPRSPVGS